MLVALLPALFVVSALVFAQSGDTLAIKSQNAKQLMAAGKYEEAVAVYRQLVKAVPGNPGLLLNLGLAEYMAGDEHAAIQHLEAVIKTEPKLIPALLALGSARLAIGQPDQAIAPLQRAIALEPGNNETRGMLASALMGAGRAEEAAVEYRKLSDSSPNDPRAWFGLGKSYESVAAAAFERLQKIDPQSPYVASLLADTRVQRRQYRSAYFFYEQALKQLPDLHGIHAALSLVYNKASHPDWAAEEDAKERALPAADCGKHKPECLFFAGRYVEAIMLPRAAKPPAEALYFQAKAANELALQAFSRLTQLPPSVESHRLQAEIEGSQNRHLEAVKEWKAALELSPGNPELLREMATSYFLAQDYRSALDLSIKLLETDPKSAQLNYIAGDSQLHLEEPEKAVPYLEAALHADPKMQAADASLGLALSRLGKNAEAIPHLEKANGLDADGSLHYQLARAYQSAGDSAKAQSTMQQYQEILKRNQEQKDEVAREAQITAPEK